MSLVCGWLTQIGHHVVTCRDPGSTRLGEAVRGLLLDRHDLAIGRRSEMLLYMAARAQLVEEVVRPALEAGRTVVSDRYLLANVVYQAHAGGLDVEETWQIGTIATQGLSPDLTIILDLEAETAWNRLDRQHDRMESQGLEFLRRVRNGFLAEAARHPERMVVIDAAADPATVQAAIQAATRPWLGK
jgi:dTMP kinase